MTAKALTLVPRLVLYDGKRIRSMHAVCYASAPLQTFQVFVYQRAGVCNLCNSGVAWVAKRDSSQSIAFCAVQSKSAEPYLRA